jgi:RimJ/RimL family protein N-acetyltransferase
MSPAATTAPLPITLRRATPADAGAAHQGGGEGTALMQAACDHADRWAQRLRLELTVFVDNARAIALYRRFGFQQEGRHRAYALRDGAYVDVLSMARLHPHPPAALGLPVGEPE